MSTLEKLGLALFLLAGGLALAADQFGLPHLFRVALIAFGLVACITGLRIIRRGVAIEGKTRVRDPRYIQRYTGVSATLIGAVLLLAGPIIVGLSVMDLRGGGGAESFLSGLAETSYGLALLLGIAGLVGIALGVVRLLSGSATAPGTHARPIELSIKLGGDITALVGVLLLALAAAYFFAPNLPQELAQHLVHLVRHLPEGR